MPRAGLSYRGKAPSSYNLSVSLRSTAPLVGEPLAKPFTLRGLPKPLPLGEVSPKVTERASPAGKSRCAAMGRLFVRAILSLCQSCLSAALPSQSRRKLLASSPKGGAIGMSVSFRLDAESPTGRKRAGLAAKASGSLTRCVVQKPLSP